MTDQILDRNFQNLASAIVLQAEKDYVDSILYDEESKRQECLKFFKSGWFLQLCDLDPDFLIKRLTNGANRFLDLTVEKLNEGFIRKKKIQKYRAFVCPICGGDVYIKRGKVSYIPSEKRRINGIIIRCATCGTTLKREDEQ